MRSAGPRRRLLREANFGFDWSAPCPYSPPVPETGILPCPGEPLSRGEKSGVPNCAQINRLEKGEMLRVHKEAARSLIVRYTQRINEQSTGRQRQEPRSSQHPFVPCTNFHNGFSLQGHFCFFILSLLFLNKQIETISYGYIQCLWNTPQEVTMEKTWTVLQELNI